MTEPIDPRQIRAKLDEIKGDVTTSTDEAKGYAATAGVGLGTLLFLLAFLLGRKKGKRSKSVVEIRRI